MGPEFHVILQGEDKPQQVLFEEIRDIRDRISSVILLWDYNSYIINVAGHFFIINGGKRVVPDFLKDVKNPKLDYARRNTASVNRKELDMIEEGKPLNLSEKAFHSYIFGIFDADQPESHHQTFIEISEDGKWWTWRPRRK